MAAVLDLISDAMKEIGALAAGETPAAEEAADALSAFNRMVNAWKAERVFIYQNTATTWAIGANDGTYTVGVGGNVNVLRPVRVDAVSYKDTSATTPVEVLLRLMTHQDWEGIAAKTLTSNEPLAAYYNLTYPLATLELWPVPTSATLTGTLYAPEAVAEFANLAAAVSLPPGYERMIVKCLAVELAPSYGAEVSQQLERQAQDSMAVVLRANKRLEELRFPPDAMMRNFYDITTDRG